MTKTIQFSFNNLYQKLMLWLLSTAFVIISIGAYFALNNIVAEQSRIQQQSVSPVYSLVNKELLKPLYIAETFAKSVNFEQILATEKFEQDKLLAQLARMEKELDLTFFVALEKQRQQYMSNGRSFELIEGKVAWYFDALKQERDILADLGQVGDVHLFFDVKIFDVNGDFLGFVGVGKRIKAFLDSFETYKQKYGYDFLFVNEKDQVILTSLPDLVVTDEYIPEISSLDIFKDAEDRLDALDSQLIRVDNTDVLITEIDIDQLQWRLLLLVPLESRQTQITQTFILNALMASSIIFVVLVAGYAILISYKRSLEKKIEIDPLSGLANRSYIQRRYNQLKRKEQAISVVLVDLDHFKKVNDTYGHSAGDEVIKHTASLMSAEIRSADTVGRWGGEEFIMLLPTESLSSAKTIVQRIKNHLERSVIQHSDHELRVTASFGIAHGNTKEPFSKLLANADVALYEAKKAGRNVVRVYNASYK